MLPPFSLIGPFETLKSIQRSVLKWCTATEVNGLSESPQIENMMDEIREVSELALWNREWRSSKVSRSSSRACVWRKVFKVMNDDCFRRAWGLASTVLDSSACFLALYILGFISPLFKALSWEPASEIINAMRKPRQNTSTYALSNSPGVSFWAEE